jgi:hypothetical protein
MTLIKSTPVLAPFFISESMQNVITSLEKTNLPLDHLAEIKSFIQRNIIAKGECCERCLKAHLLKISKDEPIHVHKTMKGYLRVEIGHNGYYLDGEEVRKI